MAHEVLAASTFTSSRLDITPSENESAEFLGGFPYLGKETLNGKRRVMLSAIYVIGTFVVFAVMMSFAFGDSPSVSKPVIRVVMIASSALFFVLWLRFIRPLGKTLREGYVEVFGGEGIDGRYHRFELRPDRKRVIFPIGNLFEPPPVRVCLGREGGTRSLDEEERQELECYLKKNRRRVVASFFSPMGVVIQFCSFFVMVEQIFFVNILGPRLLTVLGAFTVFGSLVAFWKSKERFRLIAQDHQRAVIVDGILPISQRPWIVNGAPADWRFQPPE